MQTKEDSAVDSSPSWVSSCPSFSSYSSPKLVDDISAIFSLDKQFQQQDDEDEDFEFVPVKKDDDNDADACEFFFDGQVFPVFNQGLLLDNDGNMQLPMKNLFVEDCVWVPNKNDPVAPNRCQKSNSTGSLSSSSSSSTAARSSKGWLKFRDFLKRSSSDGGKDSYDILNKPKIKSPPDSKPKQSTTDAKATGKMKTVSAHEAFYVKNRAMKQGNKKKSYLPYRQQILGLFSSNHVNNLGKSCPPL